MICFANKIAGHDILLAETDAFLDGNLEIYTLELIPNMDYFIIKICYLAKLYWEGLQTLLGRLQTLLGSLPKFIGKVAKFCR